MPANRLFIKSATWMVALISMTMMTVVGTASALAQPVWRVDGLANSTVPAGANLDYVLETLNVGDAPTDGSTYTLTITLPAHVTGVSVALNNFPLFVGWKCTAGDGVSPVAGASAIRCVGSNPLSPHGGSFVTSLVVRAAVDASASGVLTARVALSGGGAGSSASTLVPVRVSDAPPRFGVAAFDGQAAADLAGGAATQAGGHPYSYSTSIDFNTTTDLTQGPVWPVEPAKDVLVDLPSGFVGNPTVATQCSSEQLAHSEFVNSKPLCPATSQLGTALVRTNGRGGSTNELGPVPVFNIAPPQDVPARFGFNLDGIVVTLDAHVRSGGDYGLSVDALDIPTGVDVAGTTLTFWGVPSDPSHDVDRACPGQLAPWQSGPTCQSGAAPAAVLRNPTSCTAPGVGLPTVLHVDSWFHPGDFEDATFFSHLPPGYPSPPDQQGAQAGISGCDRVPFGPSLTAVPTSSQAGGPAGFAFDIDSPQSDEPGSIAEGDVKSVSVTLPPGVHLSASSASGLGACSEAQFGFIEAGFPAPNPLHFDTSDPSCPDSSKLGSVSVETPLLAKPLEGSVYLAAPHQNPFGSLVALYLVAKGPGVTLKLPGRVELDPATGQITTVFDDQPQLPFSHLHMELKSGPRAALTMPSACGTYTTRASLGSWSGKTVESDSSFTLSEGCGSGGFAPSFQAGSRNPVAGVFSPLALRVSRSDSDQGISSLSSVRLPAGMLADVASVPVRCTEAQAAAAACPAASHVGSVQVGSGAGPTPFYLPGDVYLMGSTKGQPFGLAVIVHAVAGPFDLGNVVVESAVRINSDGSLTAKSDPFPRILQGIPVDLRDVQLTLDRPGFTFNPTSCNPMSVNGTVQSVANQVAGVSSRFQVGECATLAFRPDFKVSTRGKTSKASGASLRVHVGTHEGPTSAGAPGESNIAKVDVQLPVVLPARLPTLQKACTEAQFAADPAGCPVGSFVGTAVAHTPILASPLSGPAILVSHGGEAFPDLVLVLQGEGIRINLTGHTQIKKGITYNHFETVPDAPVSSFDLTLPAGPHGVLTTDVPGRNLCATTRTVTKRVTRRVNGHIRRVTVKAKKAVAAPLLMPTTMTAQNGAVIHQNTKIAVTGCAKTKVAKHNTAKGKK
jgi:hypothetical protein